MIFTVHGCCGLISTMALKMIGPKIDGWNMYTHFGVPNWSPNCEPACQDINVQGGPLPVINAVLTPITGLTNWISGIISPYLGGPIARFINGSGGPSCQTNLSSHGSFGSSVGLRMERQNSDPDEADKDKDIRPGSHQWLEKPGNPKLLARNRLVL